DAFEIAKHLRDTFTGPTQIDPTFTLGAVIDYSSEPPNRHHFVEVKPLKMTITLGKPTINVLPPKELSGDELEKWKEKQAESEYQAKLEKQRAKLEPAYRD